MSDRIVNFLVKLAEDGDARRAFEVSPADQVDGLTAK
jgi:hypothetical protein